MHYLYYNCNSSSVHKRLYIKSLTDKYKSEFICVHQTWLLEHATKPRLREIDKDYMPHGVSGVDEKKDIMRGRPKGKCAILWHEQISHRVTEVKTCNRRMCAVTVKMNDCRILLILHCYLPNDNMSRTHVSDEFVDTCADLQSVVETVNHDDITIAGDWNTDFTRLFAQTAYLKQFMGFIKVKCYFDN